MLKLAVGGIRLMLTTVRLMLEAYPTLPTLIEEQGSGRYRPTSPWSPVGTKLAFTLSFAELSFAFTFDFSLAFFFALAFTVLSFGKLPTSPNSIA